jgi:hypothetical protein
MVYREYSEYLRGQDVPADAIEKQMAIVEDFVGFLTEPGLKEIPASAGKDDVERFARKLIAESRNSLENFSHLSDFFHWLGHRKLHVAFLEVMDCYNALEVLAEKIEKEHGQDVRNRIFSEPLPPLGADETERGVYTRMIVERLTSHLTPEQAAAAWFKVQHGLSDEVWRESKKADQDHYQKYRSIDQLLDNKRQERDAILTRLRDTDELWHTVQITDEVLEYVKSDPEMEVGRREGDKIYISKIPYNAVRYLHETDPRMKRYYACHCPLLREAIMKDMPVSPEVCNCSMGFSSHYLAGLGLELKGEVLESAVKGDSRCRFVFYIPNPDNSLGD